MSSLHRHSYFRGLFVSAALFTVSLHGAEVVWEAETTASTNMSTEGPYRARNVEQEVALSGGVWLNGKYTADSGLYADYTVKVPAAGVYQLFVRKFWQHGPMRWRFGKDEWRTLTKGKLLSTDSVAEYVPVNWVKLGDVKLAAGEQTLRVEIIVAPGYEFNGSYGLDAFKLTTEPFLGETVEALPAK